MREAVLHRFYCNSERHGHSDAVSHKLSCDPDCDDKVQKSDAAIAQSIEPDRSQQFDIIMKSEPLDIIVTSHYEVTTISVKSGNFGHQVNLDIHLQTVEIHMRRLLMSCVIRIFIVCFVS